ncbi:MAG TPA: RICIN domain-containing protein [Mycobacteriales bacterium]|nr:RICIN domain-containing protein [Mycobacteriales bacterium]
MLPPLPVGATRADLWPSRTNGAAPNAAPTRANGAAPNPTRANGAAPKDAPPVFPMVGPVIGTPVPPPLFGGPQPSADGGEEPFHQEYSTGMFSRVLLTGLGGSAEPDPPPTPAPPAPPTRRERVAATIRRLAARVGALRGDEKTAMLAVGAVVLVVLVMLAILVVVIRLAGGHDDPAPAPAAAPIASVTPAASASTTPDPDATPTDSPTGSPLPPSGGTFASRHSGLCLAAPQGRTDPGAQLVQRTCGTDFGTGFLLVGKDQPGTYELVSSATSLCADVLNASVDDGAPVDQWDCNGGANQTFVLRPLLDTAGADTGYVQIIAAHSGKCLDVTAISADQNALIQQYTCRDPAAEIDPAAGNQSWRFSGN